MNTDAYWIAIIAGSAMLLFNGCAEFVGGLIKETKDKPVLKKHATALIKMAIGLIFVIIAAIFITNNILN